MKSILRLAVAGVLLGAVVLGIRRAHSSLPRPIVLFAGIDTSRSVRLPLAGGGTQLGRSLAQVAETAASLSPKNDQVVLFRVDRTTQEFFSEGAPDDEDNFTWLLIKRTQNAPAQDGTYPALFWDAVAARVAHITSPTAIALWSDGDDDSKTYAHRMLMSKAIRELAANPHLVSVDLFGVEPKNWQSLRSRFALLGSRFHLHTAETSETEDLLSRLEAARPTPS